MAREAGRPDPDALLAAIKAEETPKRGALRIWLGAAPGVGKTYAMLQEGLRRKERGTDVVAGFVEMQNRPSIRELLSRLEVVPPLHVRDGETVRQEMDTEAIMARQPKVALVDDLAHTNAPGSKHEKRYQDVQDLLNAGITVISTLDVGQIENFTEYVKEMTGISVAETVPDWVIDEAEQLELIDLPPEVLVQRIKEGKVYAPHLTQRALEQEYTLANLMVLRDLALRATATEVEEKLDTYLSERKVEGLPIGERILVAVDHRPASQDVIRRGWRLAAGLKGGITAVHVDPTEGRRRLHDARDERQLRENLEFAAGLGARVVTVRGKVADELIKYARETHASHLFIGHPSHGRWEEFLRGSVTRDLLRKMPGIQVHVIAEAGKRDAARRGRAHRGEHDGRGKRQV